MIFVEQFFQVDIFSISFEIELFRPPHQAPQIFAVKLDNVHSAKRPSPNTKAQHCNHNCKVKCDNEVSP